MLVVDDIHAQYGKIKALHGVSLNIKEGEIVALLGANGAGKSTFLKVISGMLKPTSGSVTFMGRPMNGVRPDQVVIAGMAHVPEGRRVFPMATVMTNLEMGAFTRKDKDGVKKDIARYFETFPILGQRRNQKAGTLSGGEQQMLAIARGLMSRPSLLLLDEPAMGLAPILVQEIYNIVKELNDAGTSILLVEQNVH
ncbi:MAG: ABC transporter ATP-binding protein, partial [Anaerolineaceae bacterium]|nr:ABC transporter ATP-binding protein [Anaerolineaceae bacterium]